MLILFLVSNMYTNRKISCQIKFINIYKQNKFKEKHPTHLTVCWMQADRAEGKLICIFRSIPVHFPAVY